MGPMSWLLGRNRIREVRVGMTESEVVAIMGCGVLYEVGPSPGCNRVYGDAVVSFDGRFGKVTSIEKGEVTVMGHGRARPFRADEDWMRND